MVVARNVDVVAPLLELYAHTGELGRYDAQILERHVADRDFAPGHRGHADEAAHFDHVRKQRMRRSVQSLHAVDDEQVRRDARDQRAHAVQHPAELLDIRFAGGVVDRRAPLGQYGGHHDIGRAGHRRLVEQHVAAFQAAALDGKEIGSRIEVELGAQLLKLYIHIIVFSFLTAAHLRQPFPVFHEKYFLLLWFPCFLLFIVYHTSIIK